MYNQPQSIEVQCYFNHISEFLDHYFLCENQQIDINSISVWMCISNHTKLSLVLIMFEFLLDLWFLHDLPITIALARALNQFQVL